MSEMKIQLHAYRAEDIPQMNAIWNRVMEYGEAFPQEEALDEASGAAFFAVQAYTAAAEETATGRVLGL